MWTKHHAHKETKNQGTTFSLALSVHGPTGTTAAPRAGPASAGRAPAAGAAAARGTTATPREAVGGSAPPGSDVAPSFSVSRSSRSSWAAFMTSPHSKGVPGVAPRTGGDEPAPPPPPLGWARGRGAADVTAGSSYVRNGRGGKGGAWRRVRAVVVGKGGSGLETGKTHAEVAVPAANGSLVTLFSFSAHTHQRTTPPGPARRRWRGRDALACVRARREAARASEKK